MRVLASLNGRLQQVLGMVSPTVAELVQIVAGTPSSATSMKKLAIKLATMLQKNHDEKFSEDDSEFVATHMGAVQEIADWAAAGGDWQAWSTFEELESASDAWHESLKTQEKTEYRSPDLVQMEFPDGWKVVRLQADNAAAEGSKMGHCVGTYEDKIRKNEVIVYSLRDPNNEPHVTFNLKKEEYPARGESPWRWDQVQGKEDSPPIDKYRPYVRSFFKQLGYDPEDLSAWIRGRITPSSEIMEMVHSGQEKPFVAFDCLGEPYRLELAKEFLQNADFNANMEFDDNLMAKKVVNYVVDGGWKGFDPETVKSIVFSRIGKNVLLESHNLKLSKIPGIADFVMDGMNRGDLFLTRAAFRSDLGNYPGVGQAGARILGKALLELPPGDWNARSIRGEYIRRMEDLIRSGTPFTDEDLSTLDAVLKKHEPGKDGLPRGIAYGMTEILREMRTHSPEDAYPRFLGRISDESLNQADPMKVMTPFEPWGQQYFKGDYGKSNVYHDPKVLLRADLENAKRTHAPERIGPAPTGPRQMLLFGPQEVMRTAMLVDKLGLPEISDRLEALL